MGCTVTSTGHSPDWLKFDHDWLYKNILFFFLENNHYPKFIYYQSITEVDLALTKHVFLQSILSLVNSLYSSKIRRRKNEKKEKLHLLSLLVKYQQVISFLPRIEISSDVFVLCCSLNLTPLNEEKYMWKGFFPSPLPILQIKKDHPLIDLA